MLFSSPFLSFHSLISSGVCSRWFNSWFQVLIKILFSGAQAFFIWHFKVQFFLPYHWRWYYVILDNLSSCFMFHMLLRVRYVKSLNLFVGVILGYISPKAFPKDFSINGDNIWSKFFIYPPGEISFSSCSYQSNLLFPLVAEFHLIVLRCFP